MNVVANKTQMMKLVRDNLFLFPFAVDMASGKAVTFEKNSPMHTLRWTVKGKSYKAFLAPVAGYPMLSITVWQDGETLFRDSIKLPADYLKSRGMIP